jgi:hypothetical protein
MEKCWKTSEDQLRSGAACLPKLAEVEKTRIGKVYVAFRWTEKRFQCSNV